jgi:hypothetical protein
MPIQIWYILKALGFYCDVTQGSTQDSAGNAGLLSVVPISATALWSLPSIRIILTILLQKSPSNYRSITILMKTDLRIITIFYQAVHLSV